MTYVFLQFFPLPLPIFVLVPVVSLFLSLSQTGILLLNGILLQKLAARLPSTIPRRRTILKTMTRLKRRTRRKEPETVEGEKGRRRRGRERRRRKRKKKRIRLQRGAARGRGSRGRISAVNVAGTSAVTAVTVQLSCSTALCWG